MDKVQRYEYVQTMESYMEENQVYEQFEKLMQQIIQNKPQNPIDYLIDRLQAKKIFRVFLLSPPGAFRQDVATQLCDQMGGWKVISPGELFKKEIQKKTEISKRILKCNKGYHYVDDDIAIELVTKAVRDAEKDRQCYVIQGFPRTKVQALALQKMGILPDKFIFLQVKQSATIARTKNNLITVNQSLYGSELENLANTCFEEFELHMKGVREAFDQFIFNHNAEDKTAADTASELHKMLSLRFKQDSQKRPPRILLMGPPGAGRTTQAKYLADCFGLVTIDTKALLKKQIQTNPQNGRIIQNCWDNGDEVPDSIINPIMEKRLSQSDCQVNGWVLEGFGYTKSQIKLLQAMRIKPSQVFICEQSEDESVRRLSNRRVDPETGVEYNLEVNPPSDEPTSNRMIEMLADLEGPTRKKYENWRNQKPWIEENFRTAIKEIQADRTIDEMRDVLSDEIGS